MKIKDAIIDLKNSLKKEQIEILGKFLSYFIEADKRTREKILYSILFISDTIDKIDTSFLKIDEKEVLKNLKEFILSNLEHEKWK